ncbi:DUF4267 domain-containing protein [Candidatus Woesearchaeota archaeon]|nr:DUF4267 domain-containing protein [Candidatus Woesearchaeota archaeon]
MTLLGRLTNRNPLDILGEGSEELQKIYKKFPALKELACSSFYFGLFRGLMELSVATKLYMNMPETGILSMLTGISFDVPGNYFGEVKGNEFLNENAIPINPSYRVSKLKEKHCGFLKSGGLESRIRLEEHLRKNHFKSDKEFESRYLQKYDSIAKALKTDPPEKRTNSIAGILFGRSQAPEKDATLNELLHEFSSSTLDPNAVDAGMKDLYGQISAIPPNIPTSSRLWTRGRYMDLVRALKSVIQHGYYEEMDVELSILKDAKDSIKGIREGKKPRKEDIEHIIRLSKEYLAFALTSQKYSHDESMELQTEGISTDEKTRAMKRLLKRASSGEIAGSDLDELSLYITARENAIRKAGVSERRIYCSASDAVRKFIEEPLNDHTRSINREEMKQIMDICFSEARRVTKYEIGSHALLFGMLGASIWNPLLFGGRAANIFGWGLPIAARSFVDSYCSTKGGRVLTNALTQIFFDAFKKEGINTGSVMNEYDSLVSQAYHRGYMFSMGSSLAVNYFATLANRMEALYIPIGAATIFFALAYSKWYSSIRNLESQIYSNARFIG